VVNDVLLYPELLIGYSCFLSFTLGIDLWLSSWGHL